MRSWPCCTSVTGPFTPCGELGPSVQKGGKHHRTLFAASHTRFIVDNMSVAIEFKADACEHVGRYEQNEPDDPRPAINQLM